MRNDPETQKAVDRYVQDRVDISIRDQVEAFKRQKLDEALEQCTDKQQALFHRIFPDGVPEDKLIQAIELCERTIARNIKVAADDGSE